MGRSGVKNEYDAQGRLKYIYDVNGNPVEMAYDPNASKQIVTDARGYSTTYFYDTRGNVLTEIDAKGGVITRTYDDDNNLLSETDPDGVTTTYTYDSNRNQLTMTDAKGNTTRMTYDVNGRVTTVVSPTGLTTSAKYDSHGNLVESIDTDGLKTTYIYNARGQLRFQTAPDGQVTEYNYDQFGNPNVMVDSRGNKVEAEYDLNGRIETATSTFNLNGQIYTLGMEYDYDENGRTIATRTSRGTSQAMTYDKLGRMKSTTDEFGNVTTYNYDLQGTASGNNAATIGSVVTRIDEIVAPDNTPNNSSDNPRIIKKYDQNNNLIAEISPTGLETRYVYDELGHLIETIIPDTTPNDWDDNARIKTSYTLGSRVKTQSDIFGNEAKSFYNNDGQLIKSQDILGNTTTYTYNQGGQIETITDPRNRVTTYIYDDKARVQEVIAFDNSRYKLTYDELGRVKTETNELNQTTTYEYDAFSQVKTVIAADRSRTEFEYDQRRNLVKVTDAIGHSVIYKYDQYGQKVETQFANNDKVLMAYDQFGRVTQVTDENSHSTKYSYDNLSQLTQVELANQAKTKYTYDNLSRLTKVTDANQNVTKYEYDAFNRSTSTILAMGQRNLTVYDKFGQVTKTTDFNGDSINYAYDAIGRLANKTFTDSRISTVAYTYDSVTSQLKTVLDGRGITSYTYDQRDRLKTMLTPDQKSVTYGYDLLDNITSVTTQAATINYSYDALNRLDTVKDGSRLLADYDYDLVGNRTQTKLADGSVESRLYDARNRLTQLTTKNVTGTVFSGFTYTLDGVGNRTKVVENTGRTVDYAYDVVNRLTQEQITDSVSGNRTFGYSYDLMGNRLSKSDTLEGATSYLYDANNRLTSTTAGTKVTSFSYDSNGSLKLRSDGSKSVVYDWLNDGENRLVGVSSTSAGVSSQSSFVYDAFGSRVSSTTDGVKTNYLTAPIWDLPEVLLEYDANGNVTADYTQGIGLVRSRRNSLEGFYHGDGLGSTRVVTDNVGLITDRYAYDAFGVTLEQSGTFGNSTQFAGEQRDSATGLDYLRARYYDPMLGRFISKDAFGGFMDDPMSQNPYVYANNNPVKYTDPSGYFSIGELAAGIAITGILISGSASAGYVGASYLTGASSSPEDLLNFADQWVAGFAHVVSFGQSTRYRNWAYGEDASQNHQGFLWNMGMLSGASVSILTGMRIPANLTFGMGTAKWLATAHTAGGTFTAAFDFGSRVRDKGLAGLEWQDAFLLLPFLPYAAPAARTFLGNARAINGKLKDWGQMRVRSSAEPVFEPSVEPVPKGNCFAAGTKILTTEGEKNIEDIKVGDWVISDDPNTPGDIEAKQVLDTFVRETTALVEIYIEGDVISTTGEHPFWVADKGWVKAKDLEVGSLLQTEDGRVIDIDKIEKREGQFEVYNFNVEGFHTYFVSELGILVHNTCVYTTTDNRVNLNRPEGTFVTRENITDPQTLYEHIRRNVPRGNRPKDQYYPNFVTAIDVAEEALGIDPGGRLGVTAWIPPNTNGAKISNVWSVAEPVIGEPAVLTLLD
ncbi:polymorphic toxin-type HINT domain-containing protein [Tumidithrix elongata RA019]|uniref:Polymorphic toxin-type HINT domain-containing protein n=1 Tax=Tumidithrix elongata BACA0141 TaxID=2716417 RepID=A0AAW9Q882_9CYAN|nr:polymorphic toxin-type HINT domain-containing protein [Tumidithrix elongata RA019]